MRFARTVPVCVVVDRLRALHRWWMAGAPLIVGAAILSLVAWDAVGRGRHLLQISEGYGVTVDPPAIDRASPTGYAEGRRSLVLPGAATDAHHWMMHTQAMIATGDWRIRRVDYDNAPEGREMHWASPFRWWLAALAAVDHVLSHRPIGISVERAVLYSGPVMLALVALGVTLLLGRTGTGWLPVLLIGSMVTVQPFYLDYVVGRADHHGVANLCGFLTIWLLLAGSGVAGGWVSPAPTGDAAARRCFVGSAISGGIGLWISAATQVSVLVGAGLGVLVAGWLARGAGRRIAWLKDPDLFRLWGRVGAATSLAAYLIEYFPHHFGLRLEVNHPLYALAWLGAGEVLRAYARAMRDGWSALTRRDRIAGAVGASLVVLLPGTLMVGGEQVFLVRDPLVWGIGTRHVAEGQSLGRVLAASESLVTWVALTLPAVWLLLPLGWAWRAGFPRERLALIALAWMPAVMGWMLGVAQIRWLGQSWALTMPLMVVSILVLKSRWVGRPRMVGWWSVAVGLLFVPGGIHAVRQSQAATETSPHEIRQLAERDLAHWLRLRTTEEPAVVAAAPGATTALIAYGGLRGIGTLYWENTDGMRKLGNFQAAPTAGAARELARRWGLTHIVAVSWSAFESALVRETRGLSADAPVPEDAFIMRLLASPVPEPWLRAVPFRLPAHEALAGAQVRIWEVVDDQTPAEAAAHAANYFLEMGLIDQARRLTAVLARFEHELCANVMLAAIVSSQRDTDAFLAAVARVSANVARASALDLGDHVNLVVVLAVAQQMDKARTQLQDCMRKATPQAVRRLTPGALSDLLALADALQVAFPDPEIQRLAETLLPPSRRK